MRIRWFASPSLATLTLAGALLALLPALPACSGEAGDAAGAPKRDGGGGAGNSGVPCFGANDCAPGQICNAFGRCADPPTTRSDGGGASDGSGSDGPPEVEERVDPPAAGKRFVYIAVPDQDMVVKIDATTLRVRTVKVGRKPGALRTIGGEDIALLLNRGESTATLLRSRADGSDKATTLKTVSGVNRLAVAPDGKHAVAYYDPSDGSLPGQALQEVSVLRLADGAERAVRMTVGFRPNAIQFTADGSRAFVVSEHGLSVIDLSVATLASAIVPTIKLRSANEGLPSEVIVTSDGARALVRMPGLAGVRVVELPGGAMTTLTLPAEPSDLDVTADGKRALATLRDSKQVALIDLPADITQPSGIDVFDTKHAVGQAVITADGATALLFSNASDLELVVRLDVSSGKVETIQLEKGVRSVRLSPDNKTALVVHNKKPGTPSANDPFDVFIDRSYGFSLVELSRRFVKLQLVDAAPGSSAFAVDGSSAYVLVGDRARAVRDVSVVDLRSFLADNVTLGSHPLTVGVVPQAGQIYVAQSHPVGRVTFIDAKTREPRTLTGFALNSEVIE